MLDLTNENNFVKKPPKKFRVFQPAHFRTFNNYDNSTRPEIESTAHVKNLNPKKCDWKTVNDIVVSSRNEIKGKNESDAVLVNLNEKNECSIRHLSKTDETSVSDTCNNTDKNELDAVVTLVDNTNESVIVNNEETEGKNSNVFKIKNLSGNESTDIIPDFSKCVENNFTVNSDLSSKTVESESVLSRSKFDIVKSTDTLNLNMNANNITWSNSVDCDEKDSETALDSSELKITSTLTETTRFCHNKPIDLFSSGSTNISTVENQSDVDFNDTLNNLEKSALIEEENERLKEEEEARKIEEERLKSMEEAKKIEKQMKEADFYEALLKKEMEKKKTFCWEENSVKKNHNNNNNNTRENSLKIEAEDYELFCLGRENGTSDYIGQRVLQVSFLENSNTWFVFMYNKNLLCCLQVAQILRNLTFCEESMQVMAKNSTFLRFLLLCINSKWSCLHQLGLDMLGNISSELIIEDPSVDQIFKAFFWTVHRGIHHSNRFFVISCLEILNKICQKDENEDVVCRNLDQNVRKENISVKKGQIFKNGLILFFFFYVIIDL